MLTFCISVESKEISAENPEKVRKSEFQGVILPYVHESLEHSSV